MFNLTDKDYRIAKHVQAEICCEMEQEHLAEAARAAQHSTTGEAGWPTLMHLPPRWALKAALIALVLLAILAGVGQAFAQGAEPVRRDAGGPTEPFPEAMRAYREGCYSLHYSQYLQAVDWLTQAVQGIPAEVMIEVPAYQDMFWTLGEAQEAAGFISAAYLSYKTWLTLAGENAAPSPVLLQRGLYCSDNPGQGKR